MHEFDDRLVYSHEDQPTSIIELWNLEIGQDGAQRNTLQRVGDRLHRNQILLDH